jgi:endonuclease YncB( thermonuclease family)
MVFQKEVTVEYDKRDRNGRVVGKVFVEGNDICPARRHSYQDLSNFCG